VFGAGGCGNRAADTPDAAVDAHTVVHHDFAGTADDLSDPLSPDPNMMMMSGDGGPPLTKLDEQPTANKVICGMGPCDTTTDHCCGGSSGFSCSPTATACTGMITFGCDGTEDCATGSVCCISPGNMSIKTGCATSCGMGQPQACHNASQCPSDHPVCCKGGLPIGLCLPMGACS
jgi:hypothetical protein